MKKYSLLLLALFKLIGNSASAQNIVSVNEFTGTATAAIPLYSVQSGGVSLPITLFYSGTGVRIKDSEGNAGMNWNLSAGGKITRQLRDLPDDCKKNYKDQQRLGWLHIPNTGTNWTKITGFTIANDNSQANCTDETSDINYINANFSDLSDTEPDIFYVSAPGLSCKLVFDNNRVIRTMPYMDIKVSYTFDANDRIESFTIINDKGIKYEFGNPELMSKGAYTNKPDSVKFFKRAYDQYIARPFGSAALYSPGIEFNTAWGLTKISDPSGNFISIRYTTDQIYEPGEDAYDRLYENSADSVNLVKGGTSNTFKRSYQYTVYTKMLPHRLFDITFGHGNVTQDSIHFSKTNAYSGTRLIRKITGMGKEYDFEYAGTYRKSYLKSISSPVSDCIQTPQFIFDYNGLVTDPDSAGRYNIDIPDSTSRRADYWGFYNASTDTTLVPRLYVNSSNTTIERYRSVDPGTSLASYPYLLSGSNRRTDTTAVLIGALSKITYREGGYTTLAYESNRFYDNTAGAVVFGGGIRVKQVTDYDGINVANNMVRNYSYVNPATGLSSGKVVSMPVFAFTTPYSGSGSTLDKWNYSTIRSEDNLSEEDNGVIYSHVRMSQTGAGSTLYEFKTPATNWDASASPDWVPTMAYQARTNCPATNFAGNQEDSYPFAPNIDFDFERGLINKITSYSGTSPFNAVSETSYSYTRTGSPYVIDAFRWENNGTSKAYSKYKIFTGVDELVTQQVKKLYDLQSPTQAQQTTVNSFYTSTAHKLLTRQQTTVSDGSIINSYTKYTKDFTIAPGADSTTNGIYRLQKLNINTPVESYAQITRGDTTKTVSASLAKFRTFNAPAYLYLPYQQLGFSSVAGVTNFVPATITSGILASDSRYILNGTTQAYDFCGTPLTVDNNRKAISTAIVDHKTGNTVAALSNAKYNEIAYNDFNSDIADVKFTKATYAYSVDSRTGQYALALEASTPMSRTLSKSLLTTNYIFSIWIKSTATGSITISLNSGGAPSNYTLAYGNTASKWKYYELKVPVGNMSSTFTAQFQSSTAILIDDVFFYPDAAEVATSAYDPVTYQKTAETNTNGVSAYYEYDGANRLRFVYDQDKQIVSKKSYYSNSTTYTSLPNLSISTSIPLYKQMPIQFRIPYLPECLYDQVAVVWDFGDGTATATGVASTHTYANSGDYTVTATVTSLFFAQQTLTRSITVTTAPVTPVYIPVFYNNYLSNPSQGKIMSAYFDRVGTDSNYEYSFTEAQLLANPSIEQGEYNVIINMGNPQSSPAWKRLEVVWDTYTFCWPRTSGNQASFPANLSTTSSLQLNVYSTGSTTCPLNLIAEPNPEQ